MALTFWDRHRLLSPSARLSLIVDAMAPSSSMAGRRDVPEIRFAQARATRIAYQDFGNGPAIVSIPPFAQNVEVAWERDEMRTMFERFGDFSRWIHFDKRGTGASGRRIPIASLDERVEDMRAVMDDAGVDRAFLFGVSEGGPMCLLFAATYPDRVDGVILHGTTGYYVHPDDEDEKITAERQANIENLIRTWGTDESPMADAFSPSLAGDDEYRRWLNRYCRLSADPDSVRDLLEMMAEFDVRDLLADIKVPVLVQHRTGDRVIPVTRGRELAAAIDGAVLCEYEGVDHFGFVGDLGWIDDLERFVTGSVKSRPIRPKPSKVTIHTLGRFSIEIDGQEMPSSVWGARMPRQLCKRLVAARGWPVTRDQLFDMLWPDETDYAKLGARLSVQLSAVRRVLKGGVIADRNTVAINLDEVSTDLELLLAADTDEAVLEIYAGEFLPDEIDDEWAVGLRETARLAFTAAARRLAKTASARGHHRDAANLAGSLVEVDRYDEAAHALLVESLMKLDDSAAARRAHQRWSHWLAELGVEVPEFPVSPA